MVILGIDPGIADTGWGVIKSEGGALTALAYGSIKTTAGLPLTERLLTLEKGLGQIIADYQPQVAVVEELFFAKNVKTALVVGQARGVVLLTLARAGLTLKEFKPTQVKQAVTAYGGAGKTQVQKMVQLILKLKELPKPDDAADALALAICGANGLTNYKN